MTETTTTPEVDSRTQEELRPRCSLPKDPWAFEDRCDHPADWIVFKSCCRHVQFICTPHKEFFTNWFARGRFAKCGACHARRQNGWARVERL